MERIASLFACVAGLVASASAQDIDACDLPVRRVSVGAYGPRAVHVVYGMNSNDVTYGFFNNLDSRRGADDVGLNPGPGAGGNIVITGAYFGTIRPAGDTNSNDVTVSFTFYDTFAGWTNGAFPGTTLLGAMAFDLVDVGAPGQVTYFDVPVSPNDDASITLPDADALVVMEVFSLATTALHPSIGPAYRGQNPGVVTTGSSDGRRWLDIDSDNVIDAGELNSPGATTGYRYLHLGLRGVVSDPPCGFEVLCPGPLPDHRTSMCTDLLASVPEWYSFTIANPATDAARRFVDIDTEGSPTDVSIGLYDAAGNLIAVDRNDGSGHSAQLSFGVGRRAREGNGRDYDGRDGELFGTAPTQYFVAVAPETAVFGPGFDVNPNGGAGGMYCISFSSNVNGLPTGTAAPPGDAIDLGTITGARAGDVQVPAREAGWFRFEIESACSGPGRYWDFDFARTGAGVDAEAFLFNSAGNLVRTSDNADADGQPPLYVRPQFSFGWPSPARPPTDPLALPFAGQDGGLALGAYYMAVGLHDMTALAGAATDGRFHVRPTAAAAGAISLDVRTACIIVCGTADFDGDGDSGTDADITAFFTCLGGDCCPACFGADFNGDGDTGTDADIEAFFRVLGGGSC